MTSANSQRLRCWTALLAMAVALVACGGGGDSGSPAGAGSSSAVVVVAAVDGGDSPAPLNITGPSRAIANTRYTYLASPSDASGISWNWGDGTPDSSGASVQKLWRKPGSFSTTATASATDGSPLLASQGMTVGGTPIVGGDRHSCALQASGAVLCWGSNSQGQLGNGTTNSSLGPVAVTGLGDAVALVAGPYHACALQASGGVSCWGDNFNGQLGNGTTSRAVVSPVAVNGLSDAVALAAGIAHTCALQASGAVLCWGNNTFGQLGNASSNNSLSPEVVNGLGDVVALAAGAYHTCALLASGAVRCWGYNGEGELGNGTTSTAVVSPVAVNDLGDAVALSAGYRHNCALKASGAVLCWGFNGEGQLGNGTTSTAVVSPVAVNGLSDAVTLVAGGYHTCALQASGAARCWGYNSYGQLGNGTTNSSLCPVAVADLSDAVALAAGGGHTCALQASGAMSCWGNNAFGQLGDATVDNKTYRTPVVGGAIFWK